MKHSSLKAQPFFSDHSPDKISFPTVHTEIADYVNVKQKGH